MSCCGHGVGSAHASAPGTGVPIPHYTQGQDRGAQISMGESEKASARLFPPAPRKVYFVAKGIFYRKASREFSVQ